MGTRWLGWTGPQVLATCVDAGFIIGPLLFWKFRLAFALAGTTTLLTTGVLDIPHMIGSTANSVALGILERDERIHVRFGQWLTPGAVVAISTLLLATLVLYLQLPWMRQTKQN